jgi:hypothetical protein
MANEVKLNTVAKPVFGITPRRYRQMAEEGLVPPVEKGEIDFLKATKAVIDYYRKLAEGQGSLSLTEERRLKVQVDRKLKELEYLVETKNLVPRDEILGMFVARIQMVKQGLLSHSRVLPPMLVGKDAREMSDVIKTQTRLLLERFSQGGGVLTLPPQKRK